MLNWIAYYVGLYLFGQGGPLQNTRAGLQPDVEHRRRGREAAGLLGGPRPPGPPHRACSSPWRRSSRSGSSSTGRRSATRCAPWASTRRPPRYGGISVARNYFLAMAISGVFAGLAGAIDMLGWRYSIGFSDIQSSAIGFVGIAVALLGRNTALGVGLVCARLRGAAQRHRVAKHPARGVRHPRAGREPLAHDPGARAALHRRRHRDPLALEQERPEDRSRQRVAGVSVNVPTVETGTPRRSRSGRPTWRGPASRWASLRSGWRCHL